MKKSVFRRAIREYLEGSEVQIYHVTLDKEEGFVYAAISVRIALNSYEVWRVCAELEDIETPGLWTWFKLANGPKP